MSQDSNEMTTSNRTLFKDFWFGVRTYQSLKTSKFLEGILLDTFDNVELQMFGDTSQDIFSAVEFLLDRVTTPTGKVKTELAFVLGKARMAPMKVMTVPRVELQAALLAARLKNEIIQALTVTVNQVFMWTDSTTVLQWINSNEKQPIFVANRVCEISEYNSVDQWNHVAIKDNPADIGTRGMSAEVPSKVLIS